VSLSKLWFFWLMFGRCPDWISAGTQTIWLLVLMFFPSPASKYKNSILNFVIKYLFIAVPSFSAVLTTTLSLNILQVTSNFQVEDVIFLNYYKNFLMLSRSICCRGVQISGARLPFCLIFLNSYYISCFMSPFSCIEFWGGN
jgi:hypothetical protein